jgi:hypothetical protein
MRFHVAVMALLSISVSVFCIEPTTRRVKPQTVGFRIAAVTEHVARSGFSPNRETYLAYFVSKGQPDVTAKVVFRYLGYEDGLSEGFADFGLVHTFKAVRNRFCDESWQSFSTKFVVGRDSTLSAAVITRFVSTDAVRDIPDEQVLPCYVITPQGYRGSKAVPIDHANLLVSEGK